MHGDAVSVSEVARTLGVSRATVYRYFRSTHDLLTATAIDASAGFLAAISEHLAEGERTPADAVVEVTAFTLERLPSEPCLRLLLEPGRVSMFTLGVTSPVAVSLGRSFLEQIGIDWSAHGIASDALDEIVEQMLRMTQSLVLDPGTPPRSGLELRRYLHRWFAPAIDALSTEDKVTP